LPRILEALVADPAGVVQRQRDLSVWYNGFMKNQTAVVEAALDAHLMSVDRQAAVAPPEPLVRLARAQATARAATEAERRRKKKSKKDVVTRMKAQAASRSGSGSEDTESFRRR
jgi:hypothetical protein